MSTVGTIRDDIASKISTLFANKTRIPRPRDLPENIDNLLNDAWGIYIGPTVIADQGLGYHISVRSTDINVVLSNRISTLENTHTGEASIEDSLHDDKESIIQSVSEMTLQSVENDFVNIVYTGDDGGDFIFSGKNNYLALTINFSVTYTKDKTYCI